MSLSANNSEMKLPVLSEKTKIRNVKPLLDMNVRVKEINNKMELCIEIDQLHLIEFFRYLLEKSLKNHFGFLGRENELFYNELSAKKDEKISAYRVNRKSAISEREIEILQKLSMGWSNQKIAKHFELTTNTVKSHLQTIYLKLDVENRLEAVVEYRNLFETINKISSEN